MKVYLDNPKGFKPFTIHIDVTSERERVALRCIAGLTTTIPDAVARDGGIYDLAYDFVIGLRGALDGMDL
jgi:hypothetical protein